MVSLPADRSNGEIRSKSFRHRWTRGFSRAVVGPHRCTGSSPLSAGNISKMLRSYSLQPPLQFSPALHRRQKPDESLPTHSWRIETTPLLSLDENLQENKHSPAKLYTLKMKRLLKFKKLAEAKDLYIETVLMGDEPGVILGSNLIDMLMKSGLVQDAFQVFDIMPERNNFTWASMLFGCVRNSYENDGIFLFIDMLESGVIANDYACNAALQACTFLYSLRVGEQVHSLIVRSGFSGYCVVANCLMEFYSRCGWMVKAAIAFNDIPELDTVSCTSMISALCRSNYSDAAVEVFYKMVRLGLKPTEHTTTSILTACELSPGEQIHGYMIKNTIDQSVFSASSLIEFYSRNYNIQHAELVFRKMKCRNVVSWSSMISCLVRHSRSEDALRLFVGMIVDGFETNEFILTTVIIASGLCPNLGPFNLGLQLHAWVIKINMVGDNLILNSLATMYANAGKVEDFDRVLAKNEDPDVVSWCAAISGCFKNGFYERSAGLLCEMHNKGIKANEYGLSSALSSCASIPWADQGRQFHCLALKSGFDLHICVGNALINLYSKCGFLGDARLVFDAMDTLDILSWNSLIHGCANHGFGNESLQLFTELLESESILPNDSTFLGLLVGCDHMGYVDEAKKHFKMMNQWYGLEPSPSHCVSMVDILGRAGHFADAIRIIEEMSCEPDVLIWKSLLGACRLHRNVELGEIVAEKVIELSPKDSAGYVLLSNLYSMQGEWEKARIVRSAMEEKGVKKEAGWSWIEVRNEVVVFHAGGRSHANSGRIIYRVLRELFSLMKDEAGY